MSYFITDYLDPEQVAPPHEVRDKRKFARLVANMMTKGWVGRPLVVVDDPRGYQAVTGSHRVAAARAAGLQTIPVVLIDHDDIEDIDYEDQDFLYARIFDREDRASVEAMKLLDKEKKLTER